MTGGGVQPPSNNNQANNSNTNNNNTNSNNNNNHHHHHNGKKRSDSLNSTTSSAIFLDQDKPKFIEFITSTPGGPIISSFISKIFHNNNSNPIPSASTQVGDSGDSSESNYYFYENPTNQNVSLFVSGNKLKLNESIKIKKKSLREPNIMDTENIEVNQLHLTRREKPSNSQLNTSNHTNNINASKIDMQNIDHLISRKKRSFSITKNSSNVIDTNDSSYSGFSLVNKKELLKMEHRVDLHASSRHSSTESLSRSKSHPELYKFLNTSEENIANENGSTPQSPTNNQSIPNGSGSGTSLLQPSSPSTPNNLSIDSPTHLPPTTQSIDSHQLHQTSPSQHDSVLTPSSSHYHSQQNQHYSNQQLSSSSAYYSQTPPTTPSRENTFKQFLSNTLQKKTHSKQFWMPDDRVTNCYECLTPFSVFKRKHHCRICGQIFCWKCSDYFIDGKKFGLSSKVRVCTYCYNLMKKDQSVENSSDLNAKNDSSGGNNNTTANSTPNLLNSQRTTFSSMFTSSVAEDFDPSQQLNDPNDADGDGFEGGGSATNLLGGGDGFDSLGVGGAAGNHSADEDSGDDDDDDEMIYQQATTTIFEDSLANSDILSSLHQQQQQQQTVDNETVPFKIISGEEFEQGFDEHLNSIEESSQVHLKNIVLQLIQKENEENNQMIDKKWEEVIVGLALRTVNTVNPNMMRGDKMDITNYVKIKKVLGSNLLKSEYIDGGVVFTKNIIHKKMRSNLTNPKLLMLTCPISYQYHKADTLIASMDILISQEEEFLKLLVERIAEKKPDLVLCEKSVSRHAKELLLQKGISVAVNVKRRVLERISRCSGYPILSSIDEYNSSSTHQQLEPSISQAYVKRIGDKNLFIICGNQTDAQCTIVLRGENEKELELVKKIFKFAIYVAYNLKLETEFFFDQCGTLLHSKEDENTTNQPFILSASPHVKFPLKIKDLDLGKWNISSNLILNQKNQEECSELESSMFEKLLTPYAHQNIIVLFTKHPKIDPKVISNIENPSISPPETIVIAYYTENDMPLGKFLELRCFNKANLTNYLNTIRIYTHNEGKIILTIEKSSEIISSSDEGIAMWNYCKICERHVTPVIPMSDSAYKYSFGKFLESTFYNDSLKCRTGGCNHSVHHDHVRYFAYNDIIAKFEYKPVNVYNLVFPGNQITYDYNQQRNQFLILIQNVNDACQILFNDFNQLMSEISCNYSLLTQDQIIQVSELGEQIKNQQVSLWTTLETISQTKENIYTLNDFIRNVYISSLGWNDMIIELFSKFGMLKNNLNTKTSLVQNNSSLPSSSSSSSATSSGTKKNRETKISVQFIEENNRIKVILEELECGSVTVPLLNLDNVETMSTSSGSSATMVTSNSLSNFNSATNNNSTNNNNINTSIALTVDTRIISPRSSENDTTTTTTNSEIVSPISTSRKSFNIFTFKNQNKQSSIFDQLQLKPVKLPNIIDSVSAHMFLPSGSNDANVIVYNDEPSTIIAYTLSSNDYYKFIPSKDDIDIESILKSKDKNHYKFSFYDTPNSTTSNKVTLINGAELPSNTSISSNPISGGRSKNKTKFSCTCFFSNQFSALRKAYCNGDDSFIHSLARCVKWTPTGGKKGSFTMSWDSRFVLKEVSRVELLSFLEIGHSYFEYVASSLYHELPIVLVKILGVFRLSYHDNKGKPIKKDVIVMDNLFYNRNISKRFDLKGSTRNRYQKTEGATLMDENLLEFICNGSPLVTREAFKSVLTISVFNDTLFLSKHNVMDYSLLVGVDEENGDIILGIIDYVRQYTWDKHFETWVKSAGIISNKGKVPTVISPKHYKTRFREAMQRYIVATCSKLTGLLS